MSSATFWCLPREEALCLVFLSVLTRQCWFYPSVNVLTLPACCFKEGMMSLKRMIPVGFQRQFVMFSRKQIHSLWLTVHVQQYEVRCRLTVLHKTRHRIPYPREHSTIWVKELVHIYSYKFLRFSPHPQEGSIKHVLLFKNLITCHLFKNHSSRWGLGVILCR